MDIESNINSINTNVNFNQNINQSESVKNQKEIAKEDDINHVSNQKKLESKKQNFNLYYNWLNNFLTVIFLRDYNQEHS